MIWVIGGLIVAGLLVLLYILRPRYDLFRLSSARFFPEQSDKERARLELRVDSALFSRAFLIQLAAVTCIVVAFLSQVNFQRPTDQAVGIWLVIDTSASMGTLQNGQPRMALVAGEIRALLDHLHSLPDDVRVCFNVSTFDQGLQTQAVNLRVDQIAGVVQALAPRPVTTDLSRLRALLTQIAGEQTSADCPVTHLFVVTDLPAPAWITDQAPVPVIWRDVGLPVNNAGIVAVERSGSGLLGWNGGIDIEVAAFGNFSAGSTLTVHDAANQVIAQQPVTQPDAQMTATLPQAGMYTITLDNSDAYPLDNQVTLNVSEIQQLRVDWRLSNRSLMNVMGWLQDNQAPDIRVIPPSEAITNVPTLVVGDSYGKSPSATRVRYFDEASPLLADLNLDVADSLKIAGIRLGVNLPLRYVLVDDEAVADASQGGIWVVTNDNPRFAYIPGLPTSGGDQNLNNFSSTLFFNAVRWLVKDRALPPLYQSSATSLIDRAESDTALAPVNSGSLADVKPIDRQAQSSPFWILLLVAAALLVAAGHGLALYGGSK